MTTIDNLSLIGIWLWHCKRIIEVIGGIDGWNYMNLVEWWLCMIWANGGSDKSTNVGGWWQDNDMGGILDDESFELLMTRNY